MMTWSLTVCCVAVTAFFIDKSEAIKCYHCNSANNSACHDVKLFATYDLIPLVQCDSAIPAIVGSDFFCRKIVQTILHPGHEPDVRVTRGCGWVRHRRDCYKADNDGHLETVCQCFDDQCNAAAHLRHSKATVFFATVAVASLALRGAA